MRVDNDDQTVLTKDLHLLSVPGGGKGFGFSLIWAIYLCAAPLRPKGYE